MQTQERVERQSLVEAVCGCSMDDPLDDELLGETIQRSPKYAINYDRPFYRVLREKDVSCQT